MSFSYNLATNIGKVRLKLRDFSSIATERLFEDEEIQIFLDEQGNNLNLATAAALVAVASSAALLNKMERIGEYSYDAKQMADALLKVAAQYRSLEDELPAFAVAEETLTVFNVRDILVNDLMRGDE